MENRDTCDVLFKQFEAMQVSHEVDKTTISTIGLVLEECKHREKFWVSNTEIPPQAAFVLYHASRNTRIIFEKMHNRFIRASELHQNPKVIEEAFVVFPDLSEMCDLLDSLRGKEITPEMTGFIRKRVRTLRNTAEKVGMLPTIDEETREIDKKELAKELGELADHLRVNLV